MAIFQLLYLSTAVESLEHDEVFRILATSRAHNLVTGVTGLLLYRAPHFLQLLEGHEADVRRTFARISRDPRHDDCRILLELSNPERFFPHWSMGYPEKSAESSVAVLFTALQEIAGGGAEAKERVVGILRRFNHG